MIQNSISRDLFGSFGLGKPVEMDHDSSAGIWRGSEDWGLDHHSDVTPAILHQYNVDAPVPSERDQTTTITSADDREEIHERLEHLGYA